MSGHNTTQLRDALGYVPPHDRDTWLRVGMALKAELGEDGFALFDEWSQPDESYNERDVKSAWKSFRSVGKVSMGTVFYEAKRRGWSGNGANDARMSLTEAERAQFEQQRRFEEEASAKRRQSAQREATAIWNSSKPAPDAHAYLSRKGVKPHGARVYGGDRTIGGMSCDGALVVPVRDATGELCSLEFIDAQGEKRFLPGGRKVGGYFSIGQYAGVIVVAEGFATGASLHEATGHATAIAFDKGNLCPVASSLREKFPTARIIIAADDDYQTDGNPGMTGARKAAAAVHGLVAMPDFGVDRPDDAKDFNDMMRIRGVDAVRAAIEGASSPLVCDDRNDEKSSSGTTHVAVTRCLQDVIAVPVSWLWPQRIARGKVTLIAGDPGLGKSQLTAALAACVSVGGRWPVDRSDAPRGGVLFLNAEDDAADTIRPRLEAAEADLSRIYILDAVRALDNEGRLVQRGFDLVRDIEALREAARQIGEVALIVIDPISAYLGGTDSHRNADVRGLLAPLTALAADIGAAVLLVSHLNKGAGNEAMMRVTGSLAFVAAARAAFLVVKDAQDPARRLFLNAKNNLGPDQGNGLAFRVAPITLNSGIATSRLEWESEPVTITANEALAATLDDPDERGARSEAEDFLRELLANGPVAAKDVDRAAKDAGQSKATIRRAKKALEIIVDKEGYQGAWRWSLPSKVLKFPKDAQQKDVSTFGGNEHLWTDGANSEVI